MARETGTSTEALLDTPARRFFEYQNECELIQKEHERHVKRMQRQGRRRQR